MTKIFKALNMPINPSQQKAIATSDGAIIVAAGPGTGKTFTLAHKIIYLLEQKQIAPEKILAVTFTHSAAKEMRERLTLFLKDQPLQNALPQLWINTFHALAMKILREQNFPFKANEEWKIASEEEQNYFLQNKKAKEKSDFLDALRQCKQKLLPLATAEQQAYQQKMLSAQRLDYDDLLCYALQLFKDQPEILKRYQEQFQYLLVDEFQDTTFAQYQLLKCLAGKNICAIGDPDQAIYGFAGDGFAPFEQFKKDFPQHQILPLSENYRSKKIILDAAAQIIRKNASPLPRHLIARLEQGLPIEIAHHATDRQEAEMLGKKIEALLGGSSAFSIDSLWAQKENETYHYGFNDIAVLYRYHAEARPIQKVLERLGLPLRLFGKKSAEEKRSAAAWLAGFQNQNNEPEGEGIQLMTLHRAKGLEFPIVFIVGCEEGILPAQDANIEEERRLFYVGVTRAKNRLFLSCAKERFLYGQTLRSQPSGFLNDIEENLRILEELKTNPPKKKPAQQLSLFD